VIPDAEGSRDRREREAQVIARRIAEMTGMTGAPPMELTEGDRSRPVRCRDIMILFRATSDIQMYEDALADRGLPYYTVKGRGFYTSDEVQDLARLLAVIENPTHDVAMAAVLRSPLVGASDEALYWLGAPAEPIEGDEEAPEPPAAGRIARRLEKLEDLTNLSAGDRKRLAAFRALLRDLRQAAARRSIADLLEDAIRGSDYDLKVLCQRNGRRRYANIAKLRGVALAFQEDSGFALRHFIDYLETLQTLAERETEAATEAEEADVVRLMTIHAAKGLEAPVVIVADLDRRQKADADRAILSDSGELALRLSSPTGDKVANPPDYERLRAQADAADRGEDKRLFYVACTRAQEHLILSGCGLQSAPAKGKAAGAPRSYGELGTWGQWVMKFLGITPRGGGDAPLPFTLTLPLPFDRLRAGSERERSMVAHPPGAPLLARFRAESAEGRPLDISLICAECDVGQLGAEAQAVGDRIASAAPSPTRPIISVTDALCYQACPRRYRLQAVELLPEEGYPQQHDNEENRHLDRDDDLDPRDRGTMLHDLLYRLDFAADFDQELERLTRRLSEAERADARRVLEQFHRSDLWRLLAEADKQGTLRRETPFVIKLGDGLLRGLIDALIRGDVATIVDYKSGGARDGEYRDQALLYALACRDLLGVAPGRGIIYYLDAGQAESFGIGEAALEKAAAQLEQVMRGLASGDFERRDGPACATCGVREACRVADEP